MIKLSKLAKSVNGKESKRYMKTTGFPLDKLENLELLLSTIKDYYSKNTNESRVNMSNKLFISNVYGY